MANENLQKLYKDVFDKLCPQIKNKNEGVLYQVIHILVESKEAEEICNRRGIKNNASLEDDQRIDPQNIVGIIWENLNDDLKSFWEKLISQSMNPHMAKVESVVTIACQLVGEPVCIEYLKELKEIKNTNKSKTSPAALCLVVPASVVGNVKNNNPINVCDIEELIDNSLYFLCTSFEDAEHIWEILERTDEDITNVSEQREVYVRMNIADGEEMIGKKVPYILKRNLPPNGQGVVKQLACLKYLSVSGLEKFNRV